MSWTRARGDWSPRFLGLGNARGILENPFGMPAPETRRRLARTRHPGYFLDVPPARPLGITGPIPERVRSVGEKELTPHTLPPSACELFFMS